MIFKRDKKTISLEKPLWIKISGGILAALLVVMLGLGWYWSRTPDTFWVTHKADDGQTVVGYATADTLVRVAETLLDKPGGFLSNDRMPPGIFLDNIPNWEVGVLQQVRDLARVTRNDYSRSQSQSREDVDLAAAEPAFFVDHTSWVLPRPESEYRDAIRGFSRYRDRLAGTAEPEAQFFARANNERGIGAIAFQRSDWIHGRLCVRREIINAEPGRGQSGHHYECNQQPGRLPEHQPIE